MPFFLVVTLRFERERYLPARHVERQRAVLVDDLPFVADLAQPLCGAPPHVDLLARLESASDMVQAVAERHAMTRDNDELADFIRHRPVITIEPLLGTPPQ